MYTALWSISGPQLVRNRSRNATKQRVARSNQTPAQHSFQDIAAGHRIGLWIIAQTLTLLGHRFALECGTTNFMKGISP
jgi:hypothetical protein